ncbi:substrate-binding domain-containing protein [Streptomyces sp. NPDC057307]|uniref:substrate-binding domain-containing protein n=1 Tax=Streptomyces sp. NPDC057307 TaxID=3346096 RepID=UPI00362A1F78
MRLRMASDVALSRMPARAGPSPPGQRAFPVDSVSRSRPAPARWTAEDADHFLDELVRHGAAAALCFADREAALLVGAARRRGLGVPADLSVIGYDDEVADLCEVPLTTVSPAKADIGRRAADMIRSRIADPTSPRRQEAFVPHPVVRDSTGPAAR